MKNFFFAILGIVLVYACSSDHEVVVNEHGNENFIAKSGDSLAELKSAYKMLMESQTYLQSKTLSQDFVLKMNYKGDYSFINDRKSIIDWISLNLSSTDFVSIEEAEQAFSDIESLGVTMIRENQYFFSNIGIVSDEERDEIVSWYIDLTTDVESLNPCKQQCVRELVKCHKNMHKVGAFFSAMAGGILAGGGSVESAASAQAAGQTAMDCINQDCGAAFFPCVHGCPDDE